MKIFVFLLLVSNTIFPQWNLQYSQSGDILNCVYFVDYNNGWAVGGRLFVGALILKTTNGGINWSDNLTIPGTVNLFNSVHFIDVNNGWAVGDSGSIYHTTNGGVTFIGDESTQPSEFILEQNFPNPFNPSTKIKYSVPQSSNVVIKVYDILGNEIETLVNEEKPAGTYELTWYAEGLSSGVYFYQLKAGEFIQTKKMLLLK